ncbi:MAG: glycosyltransferase [Armatimonadetes bacterium]|nr:glycosyltransferase [Armatimonadota bacterium]
MSENKLSIIIVNYNTQNELKNCLKSIYQSKLNISFEIIVVDNNSKDKSVEIVKNNFPKVKLIENDRNVGFAKANNKAIKISDSSYILLLNPDILVKSQTLSKMLEFMEENSKVGILGCRLVNHKNELLPSCENFPDILSEFIQNIYLDKIIRNHFLLKNITLSKWRHNEGRSVDWITGACFMLRKSMLDEIGLLDENYFLYYEVEAIHYQGRSTKANLDKTISISYWSKFFFYKKYYPFKTYKFLKLINSLGLILRIITRTLFLPLIFFKYKEYLIYLKGYFNALFIDLEKEEKKLIPMSGDGSAYRFTSLALVFTGIIIYSIYLSSFYFKYNLFLKYIFPIFLFLVFFNIFKSEIFGTLQKMFLYMIFGIITFAGIVSHKVSKMFNKNKIYNKILVAQLGHIGDLILTIPFLRAIRDEFPEKKITLILGSWNKSVLDLIPYADEFLFYNNPFLNKNPQEESTFNMIINIYKIIKQIRFNFYDLAFDLRGHINSLWLIYASKTKETFGFNYQGHGLFLDKKMDFNMKEYEAQRLYSLLKLININGSIKDFQFHIKTETEKKVLKIIEESGVGADRDIVGIFSGAPWFYKRWMGDYFVELIKHIIRNYKVNVFLFGSKDEVKLNSYIEKFVFSDLIYNFAGKTTLEELSVFIKKCNIFISNDTGPMHMAIAQNIPAMAFFGPTSSKRWFVAPGEKYFLLKKEVACSPCKQLNHSFIPDQCIHPEISCIEKINLKEAVNIFDYAAKKYINNGKDCVNLK